MRRTKIHRIRDLSGGVFDNFFDLVNPKKMFSYMGEEIKNKR